MGLPGEVLQAQTTTEPIGHRALVLTGDAINGATPERLAEIGEAVGVLIGEGTIWQIVNGYDNAEISPEPIPVGRADFREFAARSETQFSKRLADLAWWSIRHTHFAMRSPSLYHYHLDPGPRLAFLGDSLDAPVELRSLWNRLSVTRFSVGAWHDGSKLRVGFMRAFAEGRLGIDPTSE